MKTQFIRKLKDGELINDLFAVKFKKPPVDYKGKKGQWFELRISDKSGEISTKYWGNENQEITKSLYDSFDKGDVVNIKGIASEYPPGTGNLQISIDASSGEIKKCAPHEYNISDFIPETEKDVEEMFEKLMGIIEEIKNTNLKSLLSEFFEDEHFVDEFKKCPAAIHRHQNYIGGLLEHVLNVTMICKKIHDLYPKLDRDLLLSGALLHDVGKVRELEVDTSIDVSREGMLLGHLPIGAIMVKEKIDGQEKFPEKLKLKILHIILSHHGRLEYGSPKTPQFPEAWAVYYADELDAKVDYALRLKEEASTEDPWIWNKDFGHIYLE